MTTELVPAKVRLSDQLGHADREQAAFEEWLADTCPSGDVTEVQRQWETSSALQNFMEAEADRECDVAFVERGMARLREGLK